MTADPTFPTTNPPAQDTIYLDRAAGRIAYDVIGQEPLMVLSPGMAETRGSYRFLAPADRPRHRRQAGFSSRNAG
jgi:hypothetical protein